jgi:hypothetical protein
VLVFGRRVGGLHGDVVRNNGLLLKLKVLEDIGLKSLLDLCDFTRLDIVEDSTRSLQGKQSIWHNLRKAMKL